ncbi:MAG: hypothetical protein M1838_003929 [Thelocarpon superellum]|nr:MAG: hypothetical protein M1838_003929 [Thelocarpon superellum]
MESSSAGSVDSKPSPAPSTAASTISAEPPSAAAEKTPDDSSKLRTFLSILRKFIGVADIASVRFSLPAQLLEPIPNLEYWNYLDRPETFAAIGDPDDALGRMLASLRFWFTKDLKYVKGKPCKPYNSALGEFFRCKWQVKDVAPPILASTEPASVDGAKPSSSGPVTVSYITEQTSHHPPVSAFYITCPEKQITACGYDQLSAKFTGTSIRVTSGQHNQGIYVTLHGRDQEQYHFTHPAAYLGGILRGSLHVTVADICYVSCSKTTLRVILQYLEEGWLGKAQNRVEGVIYRYDVENDSKTKLKDVAEQDVVARIEGCWQDKVYFTIPGSPEKHLLVDVNPLFPMAKEVPPEEQQLPNESRRFWHDVTQAILLREYSKATTVKQQLEERQRNKAASRKDGGEEWQPRFFTGVFTPVGMPELTEEGQKAMRGLETGDFILTPSVVTGA